MKKTIISDSFILLVAVVCFLDTEGIAILFFVAAIIHELGHLLIIVIFRGQITQFLLTATGGTLRYRLQNETRWRRFFIAAAGPAIGFITAIILSSIGKFRFAGVNLLLSLFNCVPIFPLDGGVILNCIITNTRIADLFSKFFCFVLIILSIQVVKAGGGCGLLILSMLLLQNNLNLQNNLYKNII